MYGHKTNNQLAYFPARDLVKTKADFSIRERDAKVKIVVIEINSSYPPGILKWHSNNFKNSNGNSFSATLQVAKNKGYNLAIHTGNMIFVREDLMELIKIENKFIKYPELLFNDLWYSIEKRSIVFKFCFKSMAFIKNKLILKIINFLKTFSKLIQT